MWLDQRDFTNCQIKHIGIAVVIPWHLKCYKWNEWHFRVEGCYKLIYDCSSILQWFLYYTSLIYHSVQSGISDLQLIYHSVQWYIICNTISVLQSNSSLQLKYNIERRSILRWKYPESLSLNIFSGVFGFKRILSDLVIVCRLGLWN